MHQGAELGDWVPLSNIGRCLGEIELPPLVLDQAPGGLDRVQRRGLGRRLDDVELQGAVVLEGLLSHLRGVPVQADYPVEVRCGSHLRPGDLRVLDDWEREVVYGHLRRVARLLSLVVVVGVDLLPLVS